MTVTIYHNPKCGTSRNVLAVLEAAGLEPQIVDYLKVGWNRDQLLSVFAAAGLSPKQAMRTNVSEATDLGLLNDAVTDEAILDAMIAHPVLVNRPFVVTDRGARLCRPSEAVLDLIETWPKGPFYKEDGKMLIDEDGKRI